MTHGWVGSLLLLPRRMHGVMQDFVNGQHFVEARLMPKRRDLNRARTILA